MNELVIAFLLGVIEGLAEFLPISSTGHLILAAHLMDFTGERAKTFEVVIQLGAIFAVMILYRQRLFSLCSKKSISFGEGLNVLHIALGILPAMVIGFLLHGVIKTYLFSPKVVVIGLVLGGILMIAAEYSKKTVTTTHLDALTYKQALTIGLFQCLAVCPGFSRAGSTMSGGLLSGSDHKTSAEFSFIIAIPMMIAATGYDLLKSYQYLSMSDLPMFAIGFLTAFVVACIAVVTFIKVLQKVKLTPFALYRFALAIVFAFIVF